MGVCDLITVAVGFATMLAVASLCWAVGAVVLYVGNERFESGILVAGVGAIILSMAFAVLVVASKIGSAMGF